MAGFDNLKVNGDLVRYDIEEWVKFKLLEDVSLYAVTTWTHDSKYGEEVSIVFAIWSKSEKRAKVLATSTNSKLIVKKFKLANEKKLLPSVVKFVKVPSEKSEAGFFWDVKDGKDFSSDIMDTIYDAVQDAVQHEEDLPDDLPF